MENSNIGPLLNEIGNILAQDIEYPLDGTFLYAECASQMACMSIYKDLGDTLLFRWAMPDLVWALLDLWEADAPERRWMAMQYTISGGKFDAVFTYPEDFNDAETSMERRERILQQRFGNKQIVNPPLPDSQSTE